VTCAWFTCALREELCAEAKYQSLPQAGLLEECSPALVQLACAFQFDLPADLQVFLSSHDLIWVIGTRMKFSKDFEAVLMAVMVDKPTR